MRKFKLPSLLLLPLALGLYLLPGHYLTAWRLGIYSFYLQAAESRQYGNHPKPDPDTIRELRERLLQKDAEIARLRLALRNVNAAKQYYPRLHFQFASVIARTPDSRADTFTIDRGRLHNLHRGEGLLMGQVLIGVVGQVGVRASQAFLLSSPNCLVAAICSRNPRAKYPVREHCSVQGLGWGETRAVFYGSNIKAGPGDVVLTSGLMGQIPPGLIIGRLANTPREGAQPGTMEARVVLQVNTTDIEDLLVVRCNQ